MTGVGWCRSGYDGRSDGSTHSDHASHAVYDQETQVSDDDDDDNADATRPGLHGTSESQEEPDTNTCLPNADTNEAIWNEETQTQALPDPSDSDADDQDF